MQHGNYCCGGQRDPANAHPRKAQLPWLAVVACLVHDAAFGQTVDSSSSASTGLQEVVVTAEKRSEDVKEVP